MSCRMQELVRGAEGRAQGALFLPILVTSPHLQKALTTHWGRLTRGSPTLVSQPAPNPPAWRKGSPCCCPFCPPASHVAKRCCWLLTQCQCSGDQQDSPTSTCTLCVLREEPALPGQAPTRTPRAGSPSRLEPLTLGWDTPKETEPAQSGQPKPQGLARGLAPGPDGLCQNWPGP